MTGPGRGGSFRLPQFFVSVILEQLVQEGGVAITNLWEITREAVIRNYLHRQGGSQPPACRKKSAAL
jgi:hypothetical protein